MNHRCNSGCSEYNSLSRRQFLGAAGATAAALSVPAWLPRVALAADDCSERDIIISVYLRGGMDGLSMVPPYLEPAYYTARPNLAVPPPDASGVNKAIDLDGFFGFAPAMAPLMPAYNAGDLLVVHATGLNDPTRSHFDAQLFMEVGTPGVAQTTTGWLGRHLMSAAPLSPSAVLRAVGISAGLQRTLAGAPLTLPIPNLDTFSISGATSSAEQRLVTLGTMYESESNALLAAAAENTQQTIDLLEAINFAGYQPAGGAVYPAGGFGTAIKSTAALIRADVGVEAVAVDLGGWDHHNSQGVFTGSMAGLMAELAGSLGALHQDLVAAGKTRVTTVVMSEFGRRLNQNGSQGTDHGHGNAMLVLGTNIHGGRVLADWPGLAPEKLFEGKDLAVTIDYRDVLAEIAARRLKSNQLDFIFPGYKPSFPGVTKLCTTTPVGKKVGMKVG